MKILMLIIASDTEIVYDDHKKIWSSYMNSNSDIDAFFIQYRDGPQELIGNTFWLNGTESFDGIFTKTIDSIDFFLNKTHYDFVVRTNLSSVWNFKVLIKYLKTLPTKGVYSGFIGNHNGILFASGSGFIMSNDICRLLVKNKHLKEEYYALDDVTIGYILNKHGIKLINNSRNDTLKYDPESYHYRVKISNRNDEKNIMKNILTLFPDTKISIYDIITSDKYLNEFVKKYYKTDVIVNKNSSVWRSKIHNPPDKNTDIIISGHSDYGITDDLVQYYNPSIWWTINKQTSDPRVHALPLGITNNTSESELHPIYGNLESMIQVMNEPKRDKNLVYMNFNINTHSERNNVFNLFKDKSWITIGKIENTISGRTNFLRDIRNHTFVLCPRGNGIDTHRLWETLYMGSIPIVKNNLAYSDFKDLPICFVDSWEQITPEFLQLESIRIKDSKWNLDKLKISYWINKIDESNKIKLGTVITSSDLNPVYCEFIPLFIKAWNTLFPEVDVFVILIANDIPDFLKDYSKNIKLFKPIEGIHTAFQAQCIRLLYPQHIEKNEGVLITDMDMIPMNRFYYEDAIKNISKNTFIAYRDVLLPREIPICYNIAIPSIWRKMFEGETIEKWYQTTKYSGIHGGSGWNTDQTVLIKKFNEYSGEKTILNDRITKYKRLDRWGSNFNDPDLRNKIKSGIFSDYHCLRPYSQYKQINDFIVESLHINI